jgi:hypothetical protein
MSDTTVGEQPDLRTANDVPLPDDTVAAVDGGAGFSGFMVDMGLSTDTTPGVVVAHTI